MAYDANKQLIDLRADLAKERLEIRNLRRSDSYDLEKYKTHINNIAGKNAKMEEVRISNWIESRKILTDEQKKLLAQPRFGKGMRPWTKLEESQEEDD
jgi:hypothetical protein